MKPSTAKEEIKTRFPVLLNRGMLKVNIKGKTLKLSGQILAVQAMDQHIMQGYIPKDCKAMLSYENHDNKEAIYTYRF